MRQFAEFTGMATTPGGALSDISRRRFCARSASRYPACAELSLFGQDTWRLTPRLTLTYGLRWDINPALKGKNLANQPFTVIRPERSGDHGVGAPRHSALRHDLWKRGAKDWDLPISSAESRIGASVLRAGFGIFYDLGYGSLGGVSSYFPYQAVKSLWLVPFPLRAANAVPPPLTTNPPGWHHSRSPP